MLAVLQRMGEVNYYIGIEDVVFVIGAGNTAGVGSLTVIVVDNIVVVLYCLWSCNIAIEARVEIHSIGYQFTALVTGPGSWSWSWSEMLP